MIPIFGMVSTVIGIAVELFLVAVLLKKYLTGKKERSQLLLIGGIALYSFLFIMDMLAAPEMVASEIYMKLIYTLGILGVALIFNFFILLIAETEKARTYMILGDWISSSIVVTAVLMWSDYRLLYDAVYGRYYLDLSEGIFYFIGTYYTVITVVMLVFYFRKIRVLEGRALEKTRLFGIGFTVWLIPFIMFLLIGWDELSYIVVYLGHLIMAYTVIKK